MVVLKGIPRLLSPQLLSALARMGHGDEIGISPASITPHDTAHCPSLSTVLADANFPSASIAKHGPELIRADGMSMNIGCVSPLVLQHRSWYSHSPESSDYTTASGCLCPQTCVSGRASSPVHHVSNLP